LPKTWKRRKGKKGKTATLKKQETLGLLDQTSTRKALLPENSKLRGPYDGPASDDENDCLTREGDDFTYNMQSTILSSNKHRATKHISLKPTISIVELEKHEEE
jgi:hypothetical protein